MAKSGFVSQAEIDSFMEEVQGDPSVLVKNQFAEAKGKIVREYDERFEALEARKLESLKELDKMFLSKRVEDDLYLFFANGDVVCVAAAELAELGFIPEVD